DESPVPVMRQAAEDLVAIAEGVIDLVVERRAKGAEPRVSAESVVRTGGVDEFLVLAVVLGSPGIEAEELLHGGIKAAQRDPVPGENSARIGSIRRLDQRGRIVDGVTDAAKTEVTGVHGWSGHVAIVVLGRSFMMAMESEQEEGLVPAVVDFRNDHRATERAADQVEAGQTGDGRG